VCEIVLAKMIFLDHENFWDFLSRVRFENIHEHPTYISLNKAAKQKEIVEVGIEVKTICLDEDDLEMLITPPAKMYFYQSKTVLVFSGINELFGSMLRIHDEIQENITRYSLSMVNHYSIAKNAIQYMQTIANEYELVDQFDRLEMI
jgi:hypothetical protein